MITTILSFEITNRFESKTGLKISFCEKIVLKYFRKNTPFGKKIIFLETI